MKRSDAEKEVAAQISKARRDLRERLKAQQAEVSEASTEFRRLRREGSAAEMNEASIREMRARAAVRVTERKIAALDISPEEIERRADQQKRTDRMVRPKGAEARLSRRGRRRRTTTHVEKIEEQFLFLLKLGYANLFEPTNNPLVYRCKACRVEVKSWLREGHWSAHKQKEGESVSSSSEGRARGGGRSSSKTEPVKVDAAVAKKIVSEVEAGTGTGMIARELNGDHVAHPSGGWNRAKVQAVYLAEKGMGRGDWSKVREKITLVRGSTRGTTSRGGSKSKTKAASKKAATKSSAKKTTNGGGNGAKTMGAKPPSSRTRRLPKDLASEAKPDPKPVRAEKSGRGRSRQS